MAYKLVEVVSLSSTVVMVEATMPEMDTWIRAIRHGSGTTVEDIDLLYPVVWGQYPFDFHSITLSLFFLLIFAPNDILTVSSASHSWFQLLSWCSRSPCLWYSSAFVGALPYMLSLRHESLLLEMMGHFSKVNFKSYFMMQLISYISSLNLLICWHFSNFLVSMTICWLWRHLVANGSRSTEGNSSSQIVRKLVNTGCNLHSLLVKVSTCEFIQRLYGAVFGLSGRDGMDSQVEMVSDIRTRAVVVVASSLPARGRTSAVVAQDTAEVIAGMRHTRRVYTGTRPRTVTRVTGPNSCHATRNLNST